MTSFLIAALVLALVAVAFATRPLWRQARGLAIALALLIPVAGGAMYALIGNPLALDPASLKQPESIDEAVAQLEKRLEAQPDDVEGRVLLARSYAAMGKFELAEAAFARALVAQPDNIALSVEYAEAQLRASPDGQFTAKSAAILENAVRREPDSQRALFLLGVQRLRSGRPAEAAALWEKLLPSVPAEAATALREEINAARADAGMPPMGEAAAITSGPGVTITLDVAPDLLAEVKPGDVVFVFARPPGGAGPPVAARRISLSELPMTLTLTDADSPMPAMKLSTQPSVRISARLSRSGAVPVGPGDLEAEPREARVGDAAPVALVISKRLP